MAKTITYFVDKPQSMLNVNSDKMNQNLKDKIAQGLVSPLGCGTLVFLFLIIPLIIKTCNDKKKYENEPWYKERQVQRQRYEDSIKRLNELAKNNPDEYNRIIRQKNMWQFSPSKGSPNEIVSAIIQSKNDGYITLPEPIKRKNKAPRFIHLGNCYITVRHTPSSEEEVILSIPKILRHNNPNKHYVMAYFDDDGHSITFGYNLTGTDKIFLDNSIDFINYCKRATRIKLIIPMIAYTENQTDNVEYVFEVPEPLDWDY